LAALAALSALLVLPARADAPAGWAAGTGVQGSLTVLRAVSSSVALAGGFDGALVRTTDGGATWATLTPPSDAPVRDLASTDGQTLYALDARGAVRRSNDAGVTWSELTVTGGVDPLAVTAFRGGHVLLTGRRSLLRSSDQGNSFESVTPKLAGTDVFRGADRAGEDLVVFGSRALLVSTDDARTWRHLRLPRLERGDGLLAADFVGARVGYVLTSFRHIYRTSDAGHHWRDLLGTGGAGTDVSFADARNGWLAAPGFANRFDGYVLHTTDGGSTWRPQAVSPRFLSKVGTSRGVAYALANEGRALYSTGNGGESGRAISVGFRPVPRVARRGSRVTIRGRIAPATRAGVVVSMRSAGRWIARYVRSNGRGIFAARFTVQRRAAFVVQVPAVAGHGSAATKPVTVPVR
jgi:photosystem II stability/assembly factor-like uncharacterized protein